MKAIGPHYPQSVSTIQASRSFMFFANKAMTTKNQSAGLLMYRQTAAGPEVFLVHPGGPFFKKKDKGWWTIPKGMPENKEENLQAAQREFTEETGLEANPPFMELGSIRQKSGKTVYAWAFEGDLLEGWTLRCNTFALEWPPGSGKWMDCPEVDAGRFFLCPEALEYIIPAQQAFILRLEKILKEAANLAQ